MNKLVKVLILIAAGLVLLILVGLVITLLPGIKAGINGR
jgi:hypothetical protein